MWDPGPPRDSRAASHGHRRQTTGAAAPEGSHAGPDRRRRTRVGPRTAAQCTSCEPRSSATDHGSGGSVRARAVRVRTRPGASCGPIHLPRAIAPTSAGSHGSGGSAGLPRGSAVAAGGPGAGTPDRRATHEPRAMIIGDRPRERRPRPSQGSPRADSPRGELRAHSPAKSNRPDLGGEPRERRLRRAPTRVRSCRRRTRAGLRTAAQCTSCEPRSSATDHGAAAPSEPGQSACGLAPGRVAGPFTCQEQSPRPRRGATGDGGSGGLPAHVSAIAAGGPGWDPDRRAIQELRATVIGNEARDSGAASHGHRRQTTGAAAPKGWVQADGGRPRATRPCARARAAASEPRAGGRRPRST